MAYYIGLDVSQKSTAICIVDDNGKTVAEGAALTRPADIYAAFTDILSVCSKVGGYERSGGGRTTPP